MNVDAKMAALFFQGLFPELVSSVYGLFFDHSAGRGNPAFTDDNTAFDVFVTCTTSNGQKGFIAIEVKYSETMTEPAATLRPRYEALSNLVEVFSAPDAPELRKNPLQQLWREHMLSCY